MAGAKNFYESPPTRPFTANLQIRYHILYSTPLPHLSEQGGHGGRREEVAVVVSVAASHNEGRRLRKKTQCILVEDKSIPSNAFSRGLYE